MRFGSVGVDHVARATSRGRPRRRAKATQDGGSRSSASEEHAPEHHSGGRKEDENRQDVGDESGCEKESARHHDENSVDDLSRRHSALQDTAIELRPDSDSLSFHEPTAHDGDENDESESIEEADRRADSDDHVELGHREHDEEQEQDHTLTLTMVAHEVRSVTESNPPTRH